MRIIGKLEYLTTDPIPRVLRVAPGGTECLALWDCPVWTEQAPTATRNPQAENEAYVLSQVSVYVHGQVRHSHRGTQVDCRLRGGACPASSALDNDKRAG